MNVADETTWFEKADPIKFISGEKSEYQQYKIEPFSLDVGFYKVRLAVRSTGKSLVIDRIIEHVFYDSNVVSKEIKYNKNLI